MALIDENYVSVDEAAQLLKVGRSTLWRWISQGDLPAYRFGRRRVLVQREDLNRLIAPVRREKREGMAGPERGELGPLTEIERKTGLEALAKLRALREEMLSRRQGVPFPNSAEELHELREQRTEQLR